jgi:small subunit ribosomal protein S21
MPHVVVAENENIGLALARFRRAYRRAGIYQECLKRRFYEKPTVRRKRKMAAALRRHFKEVRRSRRSWFRDGAEQCVLTGVIPLPPHRRVPRSR